MNDVFNDFKYKVGELVMHRSCYGVEAVVIARGLIDEGEGMIAKQYTIRSVNSVGAYSMNAQEFELKPSESN